MMNYLLSTFALAGLLLVLDDGLRRTSHNKPNRKRLPSINIVMVIVSGKTVANGGDLSWFRSWYSTVDLE